MICLCRSPVLLWSLLGTASPARGSCNVRPDHRPTGSDLTQWSPDFSSCFIGSLQGSNLLVHRDTEVGVTKPFGAVGSPLAVYGASDVLSPRQLYAAGTQQIVSMLPCMVELLWISARLPVPCPLLMPESHNGLCLFTAIIHRERL